MLGRPAVRAGWLSERLLLLPPRLPMRSTSRTSLTLKTSPSGDPLDLGDEVGTRCRRPFEGARQDELILDCEARLVRDDDDVCDDAFATSARWLSVE